MKRTHKIKNSIFLCLLVFISMLTFLTITVKADDDKEYTVDNAEFVAMLQENGDAVITEKWDVNYISGSFTRFYKDIVCIKSELEGYENIYFNEATINGTKAGESSALDREDGNYYFERKTSKITHTIHWFKQAENEKVHYEATYVLKGVVKATDDGKAVFCYRFIGKDFPKTVGHTKTTIVVPEGTGITVRLGQDDIVSQNENTIVFEADDVIGMLRYEVIMDENVFDKLTFVPMKTVIKNENHDPISLGDIFSRIGQVLVAAAVIWFCVRSVVVSCRNHMIERKIVKNPYILKETASVFEANNISPLLLKTLVGERINEHWTKIFDLAILDMARRGTAVIAKENFSFNLEMDGNHTVIDYDKMFCNLVRNFAKSWQEEGHEVFMFSTLTELMGDDARRDLFREGLIDFYDSYCELAVNSDGFKNTISSIGKRKIKKMLNTWRYGANYLKIGTDNESCYALCDRNGTIDYYSLMLFTFCDRRNTIDKKSVSGSEYSDFLFAAAFYDTCLEKGPGSFLGYDSGDGDSGSSGCGGCGSGCGGCGGGGAD